MAEYQFAQIKPSDSKKPPKPAKSSGSSSRFDETKHKRAPAGSSGGGRFVAMSYDSKRNVGTGYGSKAGDDRVKKLQQALNRLGLKDKNGKPLVIDGKLGPLTTSSIMAAQKRLGLKADGKVTPALLKQLTSAKSLASAKPGKSGRKLPARRKPMKGKPKKPPVEKGPGNSAQARTPTYWERTGRRPPGNYRPQEIR